MIDLRVIIEKYPRNTATRTQLASILRDLYPLEKRAVNVALAVYDSGIAERISKTRTIDAVQNRTFIKLLMEEYGLQEQSAYEGIAVWAKAYGVSLISYAEKNSIDEKKEELFPKTENAHDASAYAKAGIIVKGSNSDYELTSLWRGYEIKKFLGFEEEQMVIPNNIGGRKIIGIGKDAFLYCFSIRTLTISDGITYIEDGAFASCKNLHEIVFPNSLERIGSLKVPNQKHIFSRAKGAFEDCETLHSVDIPDSVKEINDCAFSRCKKLGQVKLPKCLVSIGDSACFGCQALPDILIPNTLIKIGNSSFGRCESLTTLVLNEGLKIIGSNAFSECRSLKKLIIPSTVNEIGSSLFGYNKVPSTIVYCYSESYGLQYARKEGYTVKNAAQFTL